MITVKEENVSVVHIEGRTNRFDIINKDGYEIKIYKSRQQVESLLNLIRSLLI